MIIFDIISPGSWISHPDKSTAWKIESQLRALQRAFEEANVALNLFNESLVIQDRELEKPIDYEQELEIRSKIRAELEAKNSGYIDRIVRDEIYFRSEVLYKRSRWNSGERPRSHTNKLPFMYAKAFVTALADFHRILTKFNEILEPGQLRDKVENVSAEVNNSFPDLREVRNSIHHPEDRARGLGGFNRVTKSLNPLAPKAVINRILSAPEGGVAVMGALAGDKFGCTKADGQYGEVSISQESMQSLKVIFDRLLSNFEWRGPKQHSP